MSGPFGSSQFMYATGAEEGQSLRFEDGDSAYLSWTPASAGNRRTWTYGFWTKRGSVSATQTYLYSKSGTYGDQLSITEKVAWTPLEATGAAYNMQTNAVLRDPSAWYHIVLSVDTTQATASDRVKIYVNGVLQTLSTASYPAQNYDGEINKSQSHIIGYNTRNNSEYLDSYLANVCFIDGTALDPTSFGEYQDTLWKPKSDADIQSLTFGTNGFYLPFKQTTEAEGFSTVTYTGNGGTQGIEGVGFEPDLVWIKRKDSAENHGLFDSVRGATKFLISNTTNSEFTRTNSLTSFDSSGFTLGDYSNTNASGSSNVAWCWDAGSGSPVSNTDGSITSTVKANTAKGFSIVSYTGNGTDGATVGHGLSSSIDFLIIKDRDNVRSWMAHSSASGFTDTDYLYLDDSSSKGTYGAANFLNGAPSSSVVNLGDHPATNNSTTNYIAYCFHSVSGYSSIGSYTGTGASGNSITGLGFKPAWVMIKRTDSTGNWFILDGTRDVSNPRNLFITANSSDNEKDLQVTDSLDFVDFNSDGFTLKNGGTFDNASGGTYIYMAFADTRDATFFGDTSGNGNNWTPNALNNTDVVPDSPVTGGNFAVFNEVHSISTGVTFSEGNLKAVLPTASSTCRAISTIGIASGKWYWEASYVADTSDFLQVGVCDPTDFDFRWMIRGNDGESDERPPPSGSSTTASTAVRFGTGDIIGIALDADDGKWYIAVNGTWQLSADFGAGTGYVHDSLSGDLAPVFNNITGSGTQTFIANFGQDSSFAGNETPQGNTDDNGVGDFYYAPPSGYLALNTGNLPTPTITAPDDYFNTVLYTGNGTTQSITGVGFQPDFTWLKSRSSATSHGLFDDVRGAGKALFSNATNAEYDYGTTSSGELYQFTSDGFDLGSFGNFNVNSTTYASWNWLAGGTAVSNTDGSITSQVSANTDAGFSIVSWTATNGAATIGHGLNSAPEMIIVKNRDSVVNWTVYHASLGNTGGLVLNNTDAFAANINYWNNTSPTSSVFSVGLYANYLTDAHIAYCFHSVESYSKCGSYTGNGSADGTFVHCGFRPAFVMVKSSTNATASWQIYDNTRNSYNVANNVLFPNLSNSEFTGSVVDVDFLSNGLKLRGTNTNINASGGTYIFLAFASAPFKSANAR
jgi:hypothetical protein